MKTQSTILLPKFFLIIADSWDLEELYEEDDTPIKHQHNVESKA